MNSVVRLFGLLALCASLAACSESPQPGAAQAQAFLKQVYDHYQGDAVSFQATGADAPSVFDAAMVVLLREDQRLAGGEVGAIGADPLCECQDLAFSPTVGAVTVTAPGKANAVVAVSATNNVTLDLVVENGAWRIHDITSAAYPGQRLSRYLAEANRAAVQPPN